MAHRYVWVLTRDDGISIDDVLTHCGSEDEEGKCCCACIAGASCEWHPPADMNDEGWEEWLEEHNPLPGCSIHLMWDYVVVGGRANGAITMRKGQCRPVKPTSHNTIRAVGTNSIRLLDLDVDQVPCVPSRIVNGAVNAEMHMDEFRVHTPESEYASDKHRPQVKEFLATIPNSGEVVVWGVDAHS